MNFTTENIVQITTDIWTSTLGVEIQHVPDGVQIPKQERSMIGCIQITGDWEGAVTLHCSEALARHATATMFNMPSEEVSSEEIRDTLGELTNMTAGNIKSLLPANCYISLPSVAEGLDYRLTVPGGKIILQDGFECVGQPLIITILERE